MLNKDLYPGLVSLSSEGDLQEGCDHEAGHYIALVKVGLPHVMKFLTVEKALNHGPAGGFCFAHDREVKPTLAQNAVIGFAGMTSQFVGALKRRGIERDHPDAEAIDYRARVGGIDDVAFLMGEYKQDEEFFAPYMRRALEIVEDNWRLIEAVSSELKVRRILYHKEPELIVRRTQTGDMLFQKLLHTYRTHRNPEHPEHEDTIAWKARYPGIRWFESTDAFFERWKYTFGQPRRDLGAGLGFSLAGDDQ